jgi:Mg2+ and Co2+ transporter CorA
MNFKNDILELLHKLKLLGYERARIEADLDYSANYLDQILSKGGNKKIVSRLDRYYNEVLQKQHKGKKDVKVLPEQEIGDVMGDVYERLIRLEAHIEVYESAIAGLLAENKTDFIEKVGVLRSRIQEVTERRFSELKSKS